MEAIVLNWTIYINSPSSTVLIENFLVPSLGFMTRHKNVNLACLVPNAMCMKAFVLDRTTHINYPSSTVLQAMLLQYSLLLVSFARKDPIRCSERGPCSSSHARTRQDFLHLFLLLNLCVREDLTAAQMDIVFSSQDVGPTIFLRPRSNFGLTFYQSNPVTILY